MLDRENAAKRGLRSAFDKDIGVLYSYMGECVIQTSTVPVTEEAALTTRAFCCGLVAALVRMCTLRGLELQYRHNHRQQQHSFPDASQ